MAAFQHTYFTLRCDESGCRAKFGPREIARAALRRQAAKAGWTHVRSVSGRKHDDDYCPDHKPATTEES